jgi:hypothetical protein
VLAAIAGKTLPMLLFNRVSASAAASVDSTASSAERGRHCKTPYCDPFRARWWDKDGDPQVQLCFLWVKKPWKTRAGDIRSRGDVRCPRRTNKAIFVSWEFFCQGGPGADGQSWLYRHHWVKAKDRYHWHVPIPMVRLNDNRGRDKYCASISARSIQTGEVMLCKKGL